MKFKSDQFNEWDNGQTFNTDFGNIDNTDSQSTFNTDNASTFNTDNASTFNTDKNDRWTNHSDSNADLDKSWNNDRTTNNTDKSLDSHMYDKSNDDYTDFYDLSTYGSNDGTDDKPVGKMYHSSDDRRSYSREGEIYSIGGNGLYRKNKSNNNTSDNDTITDYGRNYRANNRYQSDAWDDSDTSSNRYHSNHRRSERRLM